MTTLQLASSLAAQPLDAAGILHTIRNAVIAFLVIVFLAGAVVGFLLARVIYRRSSGSGGPFGGSGPSLRRNRGFGRR
jgi:hypothetical protein